MAILNFNDIAFISTSGRAYTDFNIYTKPSPIYAYTEPDVLGADKLARPKYDEIKKNVERD